jgi:hypothetical protein
METRFRPQLRRSRRSPRGSREDSFVKQRAVKYGVKPRGRLSGRIANTIDGKAINALAPTQIVVSANNSAGQVGPWFK